MSGATLATRFAAIGARVKIVRAGKDGAGLIDVGLDRQGEYFELRYAGARGVAVNVVETDREDRSLLLVVRDGTGKSKFLCGFDERHWFVAAIPESARGVTGVAAAKDALQPDEVRAAVSRRKPKDRFRRRNVAYVRQGEWFFVPTWDVDPDWRDVLMHEPLTRGWGNVHVVEYAFRRGDGEIVYVDESHPAGITEAEFERLLPSEQWRGDWRQMMRDPELYARGTVRHPQHNTIGLHGWHRVLMNTEHAARAMRHVAFLD